MKSKKAQSEMITTILLILVAISAVILVSIFIMNQVKSSTANAAVKASCLKLELEFPTTITAGDTAIVVRLGGSFADVTLSKLFIYANGLEAMSYTGANPPELGSTVTGTVSGLESEDKVEATVMIKDSNGKDYLCPILATTTVI